MLVSCFWYCITIVSDVTTGVKLGEGYPSLSVLSLQVPEILELFKNKKRFKN